MPDNPNILKCTITTKFYFCNFLSLWQLFLFEPISQFLKSRLSHSLLRYFVQMWSPLTNYFSDSENTLSEYIKLLKSTVWWQCQNSFRLFTPILSWVSSFRSHCIYLHYLTVSCSEPFYLLLQIIYLFNAASNEDLC